MNSNLPDVALDPRTIDAGLLAGVFRVDDRMAIAREILRALALEPAARHPLTGAWQFDARRVEGIVAATRLCFSVEPGKAQTIAAFLGPNRAHLETVIRALAESLRRHEAIQQAVAFVASLRQDAMSSGGEAA